MIPSEEEKDVDDKKTWKKSKYWGQDLETCFGYLENS